ncbi:MAG: hypothetical protein AAGA29_04885 [Planctomycetota bacterium]
MPTRQFFTAGLLLIGGMFSAGPALSAASGDGVAAKMVEDSDPRVDRTWVREWEKFAVFYVPFEDGYVCFPDYSPDRPSSAATEVEDYIRETAYEAEFKDEHTRDRSIIITKPVEDAQAALWLLRDPQPGQYGYISTGAIERIIDRDEMILRSVLLLDGALVNADRRAENQTIHDRARELAEGRTRRQAPKQQGNRADRRQDAAQRQRSIRQLRQILTEALAFRFADRQSALERQREEEFRQLRWRIVGYNTERLVIEERWPQGEVASRGLHLAIVAVEDGQVTAIPVALLERDLTEVQFLEVIASRGYTKAQFVALVDEMRREHRRDYVEHVINRLEGRDEEEPVPVADDEAEPEEKDPVNDTVELAD